VLIPEPASLGITVLKAAPNKENASKFIQLLLSPTGTELLKEWTRSHLAGPRERADFGKVPQSAAIPHEGRQIGA
jgi:ABC-type Fe3+ transport system substrate-binding protein